MKMLTTTEELVNRTDELRAKITKLEATVTLLTSKDKNTRWAQLGLKMQAILRTRVKLDVGPEKDFAQRTLTELEELLKEFYQCTATKST